jgi:hypothetical protein
MQHTGLLVNRATRCSKERNSQELAENLPDECHLGRFDALRFPSLKSILKQVGGLVLKTLRYIFFATLGCSVAIVQFGLMRDDPYRGHLESFAAYPLNPDPLTQTKRSGGATLAAASQILSQDDILPCDALPARRLTLSSGEVLWLDGSWSNSVRPFIVKGSVQSNMCRLELHPSGATKTLLGGRDAFARGWQIRILLKGSNGEALFPPSNAGVVSCVKNQNSFDIQYDGVSLGESALSFVMNESIPLDLNPRVCLARLLDQSRQPTSEWVFIVPVERVFADTQKE